MRTVFVIRDGVAVDKREAPPLHRARSAHYVISDTIDGFRSMADGKMYDSKSRYATDLRARGLEIVGNEKAPFEKEHTYDSRGLGDGIERSISDAYDQLQSGRHR